VLNAVEALVMNTLLLLGPDHTLDHAVLLRAVRCDEILPQAITFNSALFPTCYGTELTSNAIQKWCAEHKVEWH
jgi:hypothetical protein